MFNLKNLIDKLCDFYGFLDTFPNGLISPNGHSNSFSGSLR